MGRDPVDELSARRLKIVDGRGCTRATLGPAADGSVELRLYDADDRARAELTVGANGVTSLTLRDADGEIRSCLAVGPEGDTRLHMHGNAAVSLHDRDGQPRAVVALGEHDGTGTLSFADATGGRCVELAQEGGGGRLRLFRRDGGDCEIPPSDVGDPDASSAVTTRGDAEPPPPGRRPWDHGRAGRWLRTALLVLVSASAGAVGGRLAEPAAPRRIEALLRAREIELSDPAGVPRVRLAARPDGTPLLWMTDGGNTVEVGAISDVGAVIRLKGARSSVELVAPPREPPSVSASADDRVLFQAPANVARFLPADLWLWPEATSAAHPVTRSAR